MCHCGHASRGSPPASASPVRGRACTQARRPRRHKHTLRLVRPCKRQALARLTGDGAVCEARWVGVVGLAGWAQDLPGRGVPSVHTARHCRARQGYKRRSMHSLGRARQRQAPCCALARLTALRSGASLEHPAVLLVPVSDIGQAGVWVQGQAKLLPLGRAGAKALPQGQPAHWRVHPAGIAAASTAAAEARHQWCRKWRPAQPGL